MTSATESELIIKQNEVIVKQRIAFRGTGQTNQIMIYEFPLCIKSATVRDKIGELQCSIKNEHQIQILINRQIPSGKAHAIEVRFSIIPEIDELGGIQILNWGILDLKKITLAFLPFQVIGFENYIEKANKFIYSGNVSKNVNSNIAKYRAARVELGSKIHIKLVIDYSIKIPTGTTLTEFKSFGPLSNKRQTSKLLSTGVIIENDENGNPYFVLKTNMSNDFQIQLIWDITINRPLPFNSDLGM